MKIKNNIIHLKTSSFPKSRVISIDVDFTFTYDNFTYLDNLFKVDGSFGNLDFISKNDKKYEDVLSYHLWNDDKKEERHFTHDKMMEDFHSAKRPGKCKVNIQYNLEHGYKYNSNEYVDLLEEKDTTFKACKKEMKKILEKYQDIIFSEESDKKYIK